MSDKIQIGWDWKTNQEIPEETDIEYVCVIWNEELPPWDGTTERKVRYLKYSEGEFCGLKEGEYIVRWLGKLWAEEALKKLKQ